MSFVLTIGELLSRLHQEQLRQLQGFTKRNIKRVIPLVIRISKNKNDEGEVFVFVILRCLIT